MSLPFLRRPYFVLLLTCAFLTFIATSARPQDKDWRPVSPEDLSSKTPVVEPDADAEAIFWEVRIDDSSESDLSQKHYVRVKIYTERGREKYSKFDIPFTRHMKIKEALPKENRVVVEGLNMIKRHTKARGQGKPSGIIEREAPLTSNRVSFRKIVLSHRGPKARRFKLGVTVTKFSVTFFNRSG